MLLKVKEDTLAIRLGSVLTGKAVEIYSTQDINSISNFFPDEADPTHRV